MRCREARRSSPTGKMAAQTSVAPASNSASICAATDASSPTMAASAGPVGAADVEDAPVVRQHRRSWRTARPAVSRASSTSSCTATGQAGDDARRRPSGGLGRRARCGARRATRSARALPIHRIVPSATRRPRAAAVARAPATSTGTGWRGLTGGRPRGRGSPSPSRSTASPRSERGEDRHVLLGVPARRGRTTGRTCSSITGSCDGPMPSVNPARPMAGRDRRRPVGLQHRVARVGLQHRRAELDRRRRPAGQRHRRRAGRRPPRSAYQRLREAVGLGLDGLLDHPVDGRRPPLSPMRIAETYLST